MKKSNRWQLFFLICFIMAWSGHAELIINEIHYDPADKMRKQEFIEFYNSGSTAVNLLNWKISGGVDFTFPNYTISPGAYVVVAQDPQTLTADFSSASLGPWIGKLSNSGEEIVLEDATGTKIDKVDYGINFPWPTAAQGGGDSMTLINPSLDNNLAGSWRSSSNVSTDEQITFLSAQAAGWRYRKGVTEPMKDNTNKSWFEFDYQDADDGQWLDGQTSIGYGDADDLTVISDMRNNYDCIYMRRQFTIDPNNELPVQLLLKAYVDDGCVIYINGVEVKRFSLQTGDIPFPPTGFATAIDNAVWTSTLLTGTDQYLKYGLNSLAIQVINGTRASSDLSADFELLTSPNGILTNPSPGAQNSTFQLNAPPQIRKVAHTPTSPIANEPVLISAKITDPDGVSSTILHYQVVQPGAYIRLTDPTYTTNWTNLQMYDDGTHGDLVANDSYFTAIIPADIQVHRQLIRYLVSSEDTKGSEITVPYVDDPQPNFAYLCYSGVPAWQGANEPGVSAVKTFSSQFMSSMPTYHLIADVVDVENSQYNGSYDTVRFRGTLVYNNEVYDHIEFNNRGEYSTYKTGKNKWRYRFLRGHYFQARDDFGHKYERRWKDMKVNAGSSPWAPPNRGMAGVDETLSFRLFELAGIPTSRTSYFQFRVIDEVAESSPSSQYSGDLWGLYYSVEIPDGRFLDDRNLPDGNLYKLEYPVVQHNQGADETIGPADIDSLRSQMNTSSSEDWWKVHVDYKSYGRYKAVCEAVAHYDQRDQSQGYYYHNPVTDKWVMVPWDLDCMFTPGTGYTWDRFRLCITNSYPNLYKEGLNQQREVLDLLFNLKSVETVLAELVNLLNPPNVELTWADLDQFMWNYHPRTRSKGSFNLLTASGNPAGKDYTRTLITADHEGQMDFIYKFLLPNGAGYEKLKAETPDTDIPTTPTVNYTGDNSYPINALHFESSLFNDPNGNHTGSKLSWRIGEVSNPNSLSYNAAEKQPYEINAIWQSGELPLTNTEVHIPANFLTVGKTYRVRLRHKDNTGRWSHWSAPITFTASESNQSESLVTSLKISEIMYHPTGNNEDMEYIELYNTSPTVPLDLTAISFTMGIEFSFTNNQLLKPKEVIILVNENAWANLAQFRAYYDLKPTTIILGPYKGTLSNGGELVQIRSAKGGAVISEVTYQDDEPWPVGADGNGSSLEVINPNSPATDPSNWRPSQRYLGTPGWIPTEVAENIVINEVLAHTDWPQVDFIEIYNPTSLEIDLGGWWLTDETDYWQKYEIPSNKVIPAGGYLVIYEDDDGDTSNNSGLSSEYFGRKFSLSSHGEKIYLSSPTGDYHHGFEFPASENGISFGRYINSEGRELFPVLNSITESSKNSELAIGNVIISEILYNPTFEGVEFIELSNQSSAPVQLFHPDYPEICWKIKGIDFTFPANTTLAAKEVVVIIDSKSDVETFRQKQGLPQSIQIFQLQGSIANDGERITLLKPDKPDGTFIPYLTIDSVEYKDHAPWPVGPNAEEFSIIRKYPIQFADDPQAWIVGSANGSPGRADLVRLTVNGGTGSGTYFVGCLIEIEALTQEGATFYSWSSGVQESSSPKTHLYLNSELTISAQFTPLVNAPNSLTISYGEAPESSLSQASSQINGVFTFQTAPVSILPVATHQITLVFNPTDTVKYVSVHKSMTLTVEKTSLSFKAEHKQAKEDEPLPQLSYTVTGLVNNESLTEAVSGSPVLSTTASFGNSVGYYPITINQSTLSATNYSFNFSDSQLFIYPKERPDSVDINLSPGWNLISQPYNNLNAVDCFEKTKLLGPLFNWDGFYKICTQETLLVPEVGYWIFSLVDQQVTLQGEQPSTKENPFSNDGWNLIGSLVLKHKIDFDSSAIWKWDAMNQVYVLTETLKPGLGYWIFKSNN